MPKVALASSFRKSGSLKPHRPRKKGPRPPSGPNPVPKSVQNIRAGTAKSNNPFANVEDVKLQFETQKALRQSKREDKALGTIGRFGRKVANKQKEAKALAQSRREDAALKTIGRFGRRVANRPKPRLGTSVYDTQNPQLLQEIRAVGQGRRETAAANTIGRLGRRVANKTAGKRMREQMKSGASVGRPVIPSSEKEGGGLLKRARMAAGRVASGASKAASAAGKVGEKLAKGAKSVGKRVGGIDNYTKLLIGTAATGAISKAIADEDKEKRKKAEDAARARSQFYG